MGISKYYFKNIESTLVKDNYWDFHITSDDQGQCLDYATKCQDSCNTGFDIVRDGLVVWFDVNQSGSTIDGTEIKSLVEWEGYEIKPSSGFTLCDFGLTGVDNGRYNQLSGITVNITSADTKVVLYPVTGYTITESGTTKGKYDYPWFFRTGVTTTEGCDVGNTICLNGGFYQGYFKLDFLEPTPEIEETVDDCGDPTTIVVEGDPDAQKYDLMPTEFEDGWSMETWIKWDNSNCKNVRDAIYNNVEMSRESITSHTITVTIKDHNLKIGDPITVENATTEVFNTEPYAIAKGGNFGVVHNIVDDNTFQFYQAPTIVSNSTGLTATATVTLYELDVIYTGVSATKGANQVSVEQSGVTTDNIIRVFDDTCGCDDFRNYGLFDGTWVQDVDQDTYFLNDPDLPSANGGYNLGYANPTKFSVSGNSFIYETAASSLLISRKISFNVYKIKQTDDIDTLNDDYENNRNFFFYIGTRAENKFRNVFSGETGLKTCNGIPLSPDNDVVVDSGGQSWFTRSNLGLPDCWCPCGPTGTTDNGTGTTKTQYCDVLSENALGFRLTDDGRIGYRKMTVSVGCYNNKERITGTTMEEGYSESPALFNEDSWNHVAVTYTQGGGIKKTLPTGTLKFWVNGRVIYRVEDFIGLQLRALDEWSDKQLGVPFNLSWGGGTQGLLESQTFGGPDISDYGLNLENYFAGTFEGELSQMRFYEKPLDILEIRNNFFVDCNRYCRPDQFGGSVSVIPNYDGCNDCGRGRYTPWGCE